MPILWNPNTGGICTRSYLSHLLPAAKRQAAQTSPTRHQDKRLLPQLCCYLCLSCSPPSWAQRLGKDLGYALQFTTSFPANRAAFWAACCKLQMIGEREAQAVSGTFIVQNLNCAWGSDRARDVWAERRWMEPCKSSACFPGEGRTSVPEGLPARAWWGQNFHMILGRAQDITDLGHERARRGTKWSPLCSPDSARWDLPVASTSAISWTSPSPLHLNSANCSENSATDKKVWIVPLKKLFQVLERERFQPFSTVCRKRQTQASQAIPLASHTAAAVVWKARRWLSCHLWPFGIRNLEKKNH